MRQKQTEALVSDCCRAEAIQYDDCGTDDMGICPECKDGCEYIHICIECDEEFDENGNCNCEWQSQLASMESLYKGEVNCGVHIPQSKGE